MSGRKIVLEIENFDGRNLKTEISAFHFPEIGARQLGGASGAGLGQMTLDKSRQIEIVRVMDRNSTLFIQHWKNGKFFPKIAVLESWSKKGKALRRIVYSFSDAYIGSYYTAADRAAQSIESISFAFAKASVNVTEAT